MVLLIQFGDHINNKINELKGVKNKMDNTNLNIARADYALNEILSGIPVGAAYFLLKSKTQELETMYY